MRGTNWTLDRKQYTFQDKRTSYVTTVAGGNWRLLEEGWGIPPTPIPGLAGLSDRPPPGVLSLYAPFWAALARHNPDKHLTSFLFCRGMVNAFGLASRCEIGEWWC